MQRPHHEPVALFSFYVRKLQTLKKKTMCEKRGFNLQTFLLYSLQIHLLHLIKYFSPCHLLIQVSCLRVIVETGCAQSRVNIFILCNSPANPLVQKTITHFFWIPTTSALFLPNRQMAAPMKM